MSELSEGQRVLSRARSLMENGKARSWSHAIALAADTLKRTEPTTTTTTKQR